MILVFLGPPGSGKGTQAKLLAEKLRVSHIALGDMLREEVRAGTVVGKRAKEFMDAGHLVPDELTIEMTRKRISEKDCQTGFIIDGFPRSTAQAEAFERILAEKDLGLDKVVYFHIPEEEVVKRLSERRSCKNCGTVYHLTNRPPKVPGKCDLCGGELYLRHDDEEKVIRTRFEVYEKQTRPLVERYKKQGKLVELDATGSIDEVFQELLKVTAFALVP